MDDSRSHYSPKPRDFVPYGKLYDRITFFQKKNTKIKKPAILHLLIFARQEVYDIGSRSKFYANNFLDIPVTDKWRNTL